MKRLVVCCDGTWKAESSTTVSNIVKIAQTVRFDAPNPPGTAVRQWVIYAAGPGARGFLADRLMGGAFGLGLEANLSSVYWHLALNWEEGDEIYIFGFSRGAFTARSLAGLIGRIGIMTPDAMIAGRYPEGLRIYRQPPPKTPDNHDPGEPQHWRAFRRRHCRRAEITFLGVFDTVGALGVPGLTALRHRFHDVELSGNVRCARQALAIDERRRTFEPCLWKVAGEPTALDLRGIERVKQVWFPGVHSDIGGGYAECGLSDATLHWMVREAESCGLAFDRDRLAQLVQRCADARNHLQVHDSLGAGYRVLNVFRMLRRPRSRRFHWDSWRRMGMPSDRSVRLASGIPGVRNHHPVNLRRWRAQVGGRFPSDIIERVDVATGAPSNDQRTSNATGSRVNTTSSRARPWKV
ncbi:DUF2235 domain-containing protein [Nocardia sp. CNY236]|uniref:DUF2235 domain-containing protein n=1 Tax=Nocardia sp. CNY236 TaxID=1169152 RepID=UPI0009E00C02|nr:DUF2235 domain-containing protein [Nocardia sp. CNY236]